MACLDEKGMDAFLRLLEKCMSALYLYPGPTVALVNGHAIAGGCVLTVSCDAPAVARARLAAWAKHPSEGYATTKRDLRGTEAGLCPDDEEERWLAANQDDARAYLVGTRMWVSLAMRTLVLDSRPLVLPLPVRK